MVISPRKPWPFLLPLLAHCLPVLSQSVFTIENTDPRINYLPSVCDGRLSINCSAPWQILVLSSASSGTVTSTLGPSASANDLVPELFLVLRGTSLVLRTSALSNATAAITLTASLSGLSVGRTLNASIGSVSVVGLPPAEDITLSVAYVPAPDGAPTRLDIDSVTVFAADDSQTSLTTVPLPTSSFLPSFVVPASTAPPSPSPSPRRGNGLAQPTGTIVGETLAGFFGLVLIALSAFLFWQWQRKRRRGDGEAIEMRQRKGKARAEPTPAHDENA